MARNYGAIRGLSRFEGFTDAVFASFLIPQPSPR